MADTPQQAAAAAAPQTDLDPSRLMQDLMSAEGQRIEKLFDKKGDDAQPVKDAIGVLIGRVLEAQKAGGKLLAADVIRTINAAIAELDKKLSAQVNAIMHAPEFLALEGAWRGLNHLVASTPTDEKLKIRVMNVSKKELGGVLDRFSEESGQSAWDQSPIFKQIFEKRFDQPGGEPFGCLVGDFEFDHSPGDVKMLARMARICGAAQAPFLAAAKPRMLQLKSWQELADPASLAGKMATPDYAPWKSLRQSDDSRYLCLTMPRFLSRLPYGAATVPVEGFGFEEDLRPGPENPDGSTHDSYAWANSAYAMAVNVAKSFADTGFCVRIRGVEGGGLVEGLPVHTFPTSDGGVDAKCPSEIAISQRRESELSNLGFMPLSHYEGTDKGMFVGAQTVQQPAKYDNPRATENAELSARLPYVFMVSRFAHYLKKMIYDQVGTFKERAQIEADLNKWISLYTSDSSGAEDVKARLPLAEAKIEVFEVPGRPGYYESRAYLRPHIQLEGVSINLGVVSRIPGGA